MKFLMIRKNFRTDKVESYKMVSVEDISSAHPNSMDLGVWIKGARLNSRFSLTTSTEKIMFIRIDEFKDEDVEKLAH